MSVTFASNAASAETLVPEHCLCAQMAPRFMNGATPEALREHADPACPRCGGSGIEMVPSSDLPMLNLANGNATLLLRALRLAPDYCGEIGLPEARRAIIRARAGSLIPYTRPDHVEHGAPRARHDGAIEARPLRSFDPGLSEDGLRERLERFEALVEASAARGATIIYWS